MSKNLKKARREKILFCLKDFLKYLIVIFHIQVKYLILTLLLHARDLYLVCLSNATNLQKYTFSDVILVHQEIWSKGKISIFSKTLGRLYDNTLRLICVLVVESFKGCSKYKIMCTGNN